MYWIFPSLKNWLFDNYRSILRLVFWYTSQKLKQLKKKHLLFRC